MRTAKLLLTQNPILFEYRNKDTFRAGVPGGQLEFHENETGKIVSISGAIEPEVAEIIF